MDAYAVTLISRQFKADPRIIVGASGVHFTDDRGRRVLNGLSGCGAVGRGTTALKSPRRCIASYQTLDYHPAFQFGHPGSFKLANRVQALTPEGPRLCLFHRLRLRVSRHRPENGQGLLAPQGGRQTS